MAGHLECRLLRAGDVDAAVALMQRTGVHFAGTRSPRVLRAIASDAADGSKHVRVGLGVVDEVPRGILVAFIERPIYWRSFAIRHPLAAAEIAAHRVARTLRRRVKRAQGSSTPTARAQEARQLVHDRLVSNASESWDDNSPSIAKMMYLAVDPEHRNARIGVTVYRWLMHDLGAAGIQRCDACVSSENVAALTVHLRFPFRFMEMRGGYFVWVYSREVE